MEKEVLEKHLASLTGAYECYPFGPAPLVFKVMNKMFAYVSVKEGKAVVTLKCVPLDGEILTEQYESISPGYHMNKRHWITVSLTDEISDDMVIDLANKSYELVVSKLKKADKEKLKRQIGGANKCKKSSRGHAYSRSHPISGALSNPKTIWGLMLAHG